MSFYDFTTCFRCVLTNQIMLAYWDMDKECENSLKTITIACSSKSGFFTSMTSNAMVYPSDFLILIMVGSIKTNYCKLVNLFSFKKCNKINIIMLFTNSNIRFSENCIVSNIRNGECSHELTHKILALLHNLVTFYCEAKTQLLWTDCSKKCYVQRLKFKNIYTYYLSPKLSLKIFLQELTKNSVFSHEIFIFDWYWTLYEWDKVWYAILNYFGNQRSVTLILIT